MFIVLARYRTTHENAPLVAGLVQQLAAASRGEPGNTGYEVAVGADDPTSFAIIEHYVDRGAFEEHLASSHYAQIGVGEIRPLLTDRTVDTWLELTP